MTQNIDPEEHENIQKLEEEYTRDEETGIYLQNPRNDELYHHYIKANKGKANDSIWEMEYHIDKLLEGLRQTIESNAARAVSKYGAIYPFEDYITVQKVKIKLEVLKKHNFSPFKAQFDTWHDRSAGWWCKDYFEDQRKWFSSHPNEEDRHVPKDCVNANDELLPSQGDYLGYYEKDKPETRDGYRGYDSDYIKVDTDRYNPPGGPGQDNE